MTISPTLSTVEVIPASGGNLPDGQATARIRVRARTTSNEAPSRTCQVKVSPVTAGQHVVEHQHDWIAGASFGFRFSYALPPSGEVEIPVRSSTAGVARYIVEVGEDDGSISGPGQTVSLNGLSAKPGTDIQVGRTETANFATTYTTAQTIDEAWLTANAPTRTVTNVLFAAPVTLAFDDAVGDVEFIQCVFASPLNTAHSLITQNHRFSAQYCGFRGSNVACVEGEGGTFDRCVFDGVGQHAVRIEQSGTFISPLGLPDDYTASRFLSCVFRRVGLVTPGWAILGLPMRNVTVDHCVFDLAGAGAVEPQVAGSALGCIRQVTTADGARGPFIYGSWLAGGADAYVEVETGASTIPTQFFTVYACRFADVARRGSAGCEYVTVTGTQTSRRSHGNLLDDTGVLLTAINIEAGPRNMWPQVTLTQQAEINWQAATGGGGGGGGNTGGGSVVVPSAPTRYQTITEKMVFVLKNRGPEPLGTGGGARVIRKRRRSDIPQQAEPILVGGGTTTPPEEPLFIEWSSVDTVIAEGASATIFAQLFTSTGGTPATSKLTGFEVPVTVQYVSYGGNPAGQPEDFEIPATVSFAPGAAVGSIVVSAVDDVSTEGAETCRITLTPLSGTNAGGETVVLVQPGEDDEHHVIISPSDAPAPAVTVYMGTTAVEVDEGTIGQTQDVNLPVRISGNPSTGVPVRVTLTGTATRGPGPGADYEIVNPTVAGLPNVVQFQFLPTASGDTPDDLNVTLRIFGDAVYEGDETIILTLTSPFVPTTVAVVGQATSTITIVDDEDPPGTPPRIGWGELAVTVAEAAGTSAPVVRNVGILSNNGFAFTEARTVQVEVVDLETEYGLDYNVYWNPPSPGTMVGLVGSVPFGAGETQRQVQIRPNFDTDPEGAERFLLRILPGDGYTVDPTRNELTVTLTDPVSGDSQLSVERIQSGVTVPTLVSASVYATGVDFESVGFTLQGPAGSSNCQWHPLSYRPDGTPDMVRVWGLLGPSAPSVPGAPDQIVVRGGESVEPTPPINVATQLGEVLASNLKLTLNHDVNGESRDFSLPIVNSGASFETLIDTSNVALQGGGPRLFARHRVSGELVAGSGTDVSLDRCTVARVYIDCRADLDVVVLHINWGNFRWKAPDGTFTHYTANPAVDGEVFFKHLWLEGIPAGWAAELLDPNTTRTQYDAGNARVEIIRELGGAQRHYLPPLRGHVAKIALYKTASVSSAIARDVLLQRDGGYVFGGLGLDRNDAVGEQGFPVLNYGEGSIPWVNRVPNTSTALAAGWEGVERFDFHERTRMRDFIANGTGDIGLSYGRIGWWHGLELPEGGAPSGSRISVSGGTTPGKWSYERNALEMTHLWHRVGGTAWTQKAISTTDEDFCVASGTTFRSAVATWMGIGGQRMGHQHFYTPDYEELGSGRVAAQSRIGPGRKRARGSIQLLVQPLAGDDVVVADGVNAARTFRFGTGTDTATLKHVAIGASVGTTLENLKTVMRAAESPTTLAIHAFSRQVQFSTVDLIARYAGTGANVTITTTAPSSRIVVAGMSGGFNGTNVRPWNYLVQGTNTSQHTTGSDNRGIDITLGWHQRGMDIERSYHSFDWPHMSRMNRVLWDGWWLHYDPIAYDISTDLMHLGMQCLQRYAPDPASPWAVATWTPDQLISSCASSNLAHIFEGHQQRYLRRYILNGHDGSKAATKFASALANNDGLNCGTWIVRNPEVPFASFNETLSFHYIQVGDWPIERGWGWLMATVARGYCIDPAFRPISTRNVQRQRIHPGESAQPFAQDRPSWFEALREVIRLTMHRSGATASQDRNATANLYEGLGRPNFELRSGSIPGGDQNEPVVGQEQYDDEWYANAIAWHQTYISLGIYAVMRRVYTWCDRDTAPNPNSIWLVSLAQQLRFGKLLMLAARDRLGPVQIHVPTFHVVGVGDPNTAGTPQSVGIFGRFNSETGNANPNITFRNSQGRVWWWAANYAVGDPSRNFYRVQYMLWAFVNRRAFADAEILDLFPALVGAGGGTTQQSAQTVSATLMEIWEDARRAQTETWGEAGREAHYIIQWARNELGAN